MWKERAKDRCFYRFLGKNTDCSFSYKVEVIKTSLEGKSHVSIASLLPVSAKHLTTVQTNNRALDSTFSLTGNFTKIMDRETCILLQ